MDDRRGERSSWMGARRATTSHLGNLRESAAQRRRQAEEYFALARSARVTADRIVYEEFGRRALEAAKRFEQCAAGGAFSPRE